MASLRYKRPAIRPPSCKNAAHWAVGVGRAGVAAVGEYEEEEREEECSESNFVDWIQRTFPKSSSPPGEQEFNDIPQINPVYAVWTPQNGSLAVRPPPNPLHQGWHIDVQLMQSSGLLYLVTTNDGVPRSWEAKSVFRNQILANIS